jgi:ribulose-5-phosphate 4-epimerase/fuculose-1-phosphate aldolase
MSIQYYEQRELIARFTKDLYDRRLTDTSGGNVSIRVGDVVLMTPSLSGTLFHWNLKPEQILVYDAKGNKLEGEGTLSREAKVHFSLYDAYYPEGTAVVHAHSLNVLVFCAAVQSMPPVLYNTKKFGLIPQVVDAASGTQALADNVVAGMLPQRSGISKGAAAVMAPRHGLFVMGKDLYTAFDSAERVDINAYCLIHGKMLGEIVPLTEMVVVNPYAE